MPDVRAELEQIAALLAPFADVIALRADEPEPPPWCERRGWSPFLLALTDDEVLRAERHGLPTSDAVLERAPSDLRDLCTAARAFTEPFLAGPKDLDAIERERVPLRKRTQVAALVDHLRGLSLPITRVVDLGAGHGHLTRALHSELEVAACGVERDGELVRVARALSREQDIAYVELDFGGSSIALLPTDLVIGLHACGALGDALLQRAAAARAQVLLVSCCQQKIDTAARRPLSSLGERLELTWPRPLLGLSNLSWGATAVESMRGREVRHALRILLRGRGIDESVGSVAHGINKRRFRQNLSVVADAALRQRKEPPPSASELCTAESRGVAEFARIRRLSLPRNLLGRLMELAIVFDRASYLAEQGYEVAVRSMFDIDVSPRNLGVVARAADA